MIAPDKPNGKRPRLMSLWSWAGFAVVVLILLAMAFPKQELLQQAEQAKLGDSLAVSYLTNLLKTNPGNLPLRMKLAENKIYLDELDDVPALIEPALHSTNPDWQKQGLLTEYKYLSKQISLGGNQDSKHQPELMERRHAVFLRVTEHSWPIETLIYLAGQAISLHERNIGTRLYRKITISSQTYSAEWCAGTAARLLGEGDYKFAADLYFVARDKASSLPEQREFLMAGVRALMSDNQFSQAMQAADQHLGNLADDPETLEFLMQAARASSDQKRAARYARRMFQLSWLERAYFWLQQLDLSLISTANAASTGQASAGADGKEHYDKKKYQLIYEVFLENHNLADAFRVAEAAVRRRPADAMWHKRLAQVAEWDSKPLIALREWLWLLRHDGGEEALLAVLRLAPALNDYEASLEAWKHMAADRTLNDVQWNTFADLFEKTGRQNEGIKFFEARYNVDHAPLLLEIAARLAQRDGNDDHANSLYLRLLQLHGFNLDWLLKSANIYLREEQYQKAYDLLQQNRGNVDKKDVAYWKLMADLAWQLQRDEDATKDYRHLEANGNLAREDFSRLIYLEQKPEKVAALAELAYKKFGDHEMLLRALEIYAAQHDLLAQKRLYEGVAANPNENLSGNPRFILMRAQYFQASGDTQAARADFRHAIALAPDDANTVNAILWFLIDVHDRDDLRKMLAQVAARGDQQDPAYWGALAAAYQTLDQPSRAVAYYTHQLKKKGGDFLWLVNYADALDQNQQPGMALRVRQYAWLQLRDKLHGQAVSLPYSPDMLAAARLAIMNYPDDPGLALVRSVLRQDRLVKHDAATDSQTSELVLAWAASNEDSANAKAWLWQRYGLTLGRPVWGDAMVAQAENDSERLGHLLAANTDDMNMLTRHDAASATDQVGYAQSIAFNGLADAPDNEEAYARLAEDTLATASFVNVEVRSEKYDALHDNVLSTQIESPIARDWRLAAELRRTNQASDTPSNFGNIPAAEKIAGLALKRLGSSGETEIAVRRRNEYANTTESRVSHSTDILPRLNLQLRAAIHAEAVESTDLRVFGMRNQADATLLSGFDKHDYLSMQPGYARYYTQTGDFLGSGSHLSWELGHYFSTTYPGWRVSLTGTHERFNQESAAVLPLPENQNLSGLCFGFAQDNLHTYTQAWHPYFDSCGTHNNLSGKGYIAKFGLAGPVAGHDHLSFILDQEQGGVYVAGGLTRVMKLDYRYFFDRH